MNRDRRALMREIDRKAKVCAWPECRAQVPSTMYLCATHWHQLPREPKKEWEARSHGVGNHPRWASEIDREVAVFKNTSQNSQGRERRKILNSTQNTGGIDTSAFSEMKLDELQTKDRVVGHQLQETEIKLARVRTVMEEARLRRGTWATRSIPKDTELRWLREKRLLLSELNALRAEHSKIKRAIDQRNQETKELTQTSFEAVFHALAKEMLAGPVYDRIAMAAIHRIGERDAD